MKIKAEMLKIDNSVFDAQGQRIDPEARAAERILISDSVITARGSGQVLGTLKTSINVQGTVGQFANGLRTMCASCKHFDMNAWQKLRRRLSEGTAQDKAVLMGIKKELINHGLDLAETDDTLSMMGICKAITEHRKETLIAHAMGGCPTEYNTPLTPNGFFENANLATQRATDAAYDQVMKNAQGKL